MARPLRIEYPGAFYHVTSRGNEQKDIFKTQLDRKKFLSYLESSVMRYGAVIHVWCLMSNHYHLLMETPSGNLSQIMRHINGAYTPYFNIKRKRAGHLFQGRYKSILVGSLGVRLGLLWFFWHGFHGFHGLGSGEEDGWQVGNGLTLKVLRKHIERLVNCAEAGNEGKLREELRRIVPEDRPEDGRRRAVLEELDAND